MADNKLIFNFVLKLLEAAEFSSVAFSFGSGSGVHSSTGQLYSDGRVNVSSPPSAAQLQLPYAGGAFRDLCESQSSGRVGIKLLFFMCHDTYVKYHNKKCFDTHVSYDNKTYFNGIVCCVFFICQ